jgi:hypothetical protein
MSVEWNGAAVIGVKIPVTCLWTQTKVKAFDHDYPEDWVVCPKTERPLWKTSRAPVASYNVNRETFHGYPLYFTTDDVEVVVGMLATPWTKRNEGAVMVKLPPEHDVIKRGMKEALGSLFNEKQFGLWCVMHCSY